MTDSADESDGRRETPVVDAKTGESKGTVTGLEEFAAGWEHNVELPHQMSFDAWQMSDDDHPPGGGRAAYRLVHKTIRTVPFPAVRLDLDTLLLRVENGEATIGEPVFHHALRARRDGDFLVPEWGQIIQGSEGRGDYKYTASNNISIQGYQETLPPSNYVEILCELPEGGGASHAERLAAGRAAVAPLTAALDLLFGERVLGPVLTEEVGEVFDDWHWNRKLGGRTVAIESQARLEQLDGHEFVGRVRPAIDRLLGMGDEQRQRVRVASQWYWRAEREPDNVLRFIGYWLVIEAVELGQNANITPVKKAIAGILAATRADVSDQVGRLYGTRNKLVHGELRIRTTTMSCACGPLLQHYSRSVSSAKPRPHDAQRFGRRSLCRRSSRCRA